MDIDFKPWTEATNALPWGAQNTIYSSLELAAEGKTTIVYGQDYSNNSPCLINSVGQMLAVGGGKGIPSKHFGDLVRAFDSINSQLHTKGVNTERTLSPQAAALLLKHFGELKPQVLPQDKKPVGHSYAAYDTVIPERSDDEFIIREEDVLDPVKELDYIEGPFYKDEAFVNKYMKY